MKSKEFLQNKKNELLVFLSIFHTLVGFIVMTCILNFSFGIDSKFVDAVSSAVPVSFVAFKRCIHLDFHEYVRGGDNLPEYTEDGYFFNKLQQLIFNKEIMSKSELKEFKGGDVRDVSYFTYLEDEGSIRSIFNEKIHYISINSVLIVILLTKYNLKQLIPFYLAWFFYNFSS